VVALVEALLAHRTSAQQSLLDYGRAQFRPNQTSPFELKLLRVKEYTREAFVAQSLAVLISKQSWMDYPKPLLNYPQLKAFARVSSTAQEILSKEDYVRHGMLEL
jgi:hypothetical protein